MRTSIFASSFAFSLLVGHAYADILGDMTLLERDGSMAAKMRRYVDTIVEPMERRQSAAPAMNVTRWNIETMAACTTALGAMNGIASNPSGMAVCYNLPSLENNTGIFEADLRLFTISQPSGTFANIPSQDVQVSLSYIGATVSSVDPSSLTRRDDVNSLGTPSPNEPGKRQSQAPVMAQSYAFVGRINQNLVGSNSSTLEQALLPIVTLNGVTPQGQNVNVTLSSTEAAFVNGVFSLEAPLTRLSVAAAPIQTLVVASGAPFVLPGQHILITPVGGVITGVWALLFMGTVAYGTVRRIQFKEQYRRRVARATKKNIARI